MAIFCAFCRLFKRTFVALVLCLSFGTFSVFGNATYEVSYNCGEGSSGPAPESCIIGNTGCNIVQPNTCAAPTGYVFTGWYCTETVYDGSTPTIHNQSYQPGESLVTNGTYSNIVCTAQWTENCPVTYNYGTCSYSADTGTLYGNNNSYVSIMPSLGQVCNNDSNCSNLNSCIGSTAPDSPVAWRCNLADSYVQKNNNVCYNSCANNSYCPNLPTTSQNYGWYSPGATNCKAHSCNTICTAVLQYPVTYNCGDGGTGSESVTATYGDPFTFAPSSVCTPDPQKSFAGWDCSGGVGSRNSNEYLSSWDWISGTVCTALWKSNITCSGNDCQIVTLEKTDLMLNISDNGEIIGAISGDNQYFPDQNTTQQLRLRDISNTWGVLFNHGILTGKSVCATKPVPTSTGELRQEQDLEQKDNDQYCWCKATHYYSSRYDTELDFVTDWMYVYAYPDANACNKGDSSCAVKCAQTLQNERSLRSTLYNTGAYCYCTHNIKYLPGDYGTGGTVDTVQSGTNYTIKTASQALVSPVNSNMYNVTFARWQCNGTNRNPGYTVNNISTDITCTAQWTITPVYNVTYSCGAGTTGTPPTDTTRYTANDLVTLLQNTIPCYKSNSEFIGWECGDGNTRVPGTQIQISENTTCTAQWQTCSNGYSFVNNECKPNCNLVTLDFNGGTDPNNFNTLYKLSDDSRWFTDNFCTNQLHYLYLPTKTNAAFTGYYTTPSGVGEAVINHMDSYYVYFDSNNPVWTITAPATIYAQWVSTSCPEGQYLNDTTCEPCPPGYQEGGSGLTDINQCVGKFEKTGLETTPDMPTGWADRTLTSCTPGTCHYYMNYAGTITQDCIPADCSKEQTCTSAEPNYYLENGLCDACGGISGGTYPYSDGGTISSAYCYRTLTNNGIQKDPELPTGCSAQTLGTCNPGSCNYRDYYTATDESCNPTDCDRPRTSLTHETGYYTAANLESCPVCDNGYTSTSSATPGAQECTKGCLIECSGNNETECPEHAICTYDSNYSVLGTQQSGGLCEGTVPLCPVQTITCESGYYANNNSCEPCPSGYQEGGSGLTDINQCYKSCTKQCTVDTSLCPEHATGCTYGNTQTSGTQYYGNSCNASDPGTCSVTVNGCEPGYSLNNNTCSNSTINLIWNGNGATTEPSPSVNTCNYGGNIVMPTPPTRTNHVFTGWKVVNWEQ